MFKAIRLIQNLSHDEANLYSSRFLVLEDTKTKERVELPFQENYLSAVIENQMFDVYGRELKINPNITQILDKAGRWQWWNTDAEAYFVRTADDKVFIAYISYDSIDEYGDRHERCRYIEHYNPWFCNDNRYEGELVLTDFEVIDADIFRGALNTQEGFILTKSDNHYCLRSSSYVVSLKSHAIFRKKTDEHPTWKGGNYFLSCSFKDGKILATVAVEPSAESRADRQTILIETDAEFINQRYYDCLGLPFYLVASSDNEIGE